jgi:cob(I)alamin adenosyltransferase
MIHLYTGNGKGKTTSAMGLILRALGHKKQVCLIQFMKGDWQYGEIQSLQKLEGIDIFKYGTTEFVDAKSPGKIDISEAAAGWRKAVEVIKSGRYQLVVLDEINVAVYMGLLNLSEQLDLMGMAADCELVMTGRYAALEVIERADLVTEMRQIKHYYDKGITSREGIEY